MRRLPTLLISIFLLLSAVGGALASEKFNYLQAAELKAKIEQKSPMHLVDIQVADGYGEHHLPGAIATYAYPVKTAEERARLDALLAETQMDQAPVIIVCPRGAGGAERAYQHLAAQGIAPERLFILEKGQEGWPFAELVEKSR